MTSRERLLSAIEFKEPDRCPIQHYIFPGAFWRHGQKLIDLLERYPDDFGNKSPLANLKQLEEGQSSKDVVEWQDAWGITWRRLRGYTSGEVVRPALPTWEAWKSYQFPPQQPDSHFEEYAEYVKVARERGEFVVAGGGDLFQHMQHMRGPADFLMDLAEDSDEVNELADRMVEYRLYGIQRYAQVGVDMIDFSDDWGSQDRLFIRPEQWRRFFKPRYRRMFQAAREQGVHVLFHTDGWILEIIEDLIEIGVSVLNPQHTCMGTARVGELINGRIAVRTDIDRQWTIPLGTPEQVVAAVKEAIAAFGRFNGGVILHGEIGPDVPFENIEALYSAFYEYGKYPLDWLKATS